MADLIGTDETWGVVRGKLNARLGPSIAIVGDSLTANGAQSGRGVAGKRAWWQYMQLYSGRRCYISNWSAVGGYKTDEIIANCLPNIINRVAFANANLGGTTLAPAPDICIELSGTNDLFSAPTKTIAQTLTQKKAMWDALRAAGIAPVTATLPPRNDTSQIQTVMKFNAALIAFAANEGVPVIDFFSSVADEVTGYWLSGYNVSGDPIHAEGPGAHAMGKAAAALLASLLPVALPAHVAQNNNIMWSNSLFLTDGGAFPPGSGWTNGLSTNGTATLVTDDTGIVGNRIDLTHTGASAAYIRAPNFTATAGGWIAVSARIKATMSGAGQWTARLIKAANNTEVLAGMGNINLSTDGWVDFHTVLQLPSGVTTPSFDFLVEGGNGSVLSIAQIGIYDLTAAGIDLA